MNKTKEPKPRRSRGSGSIEEREVQRVNKRGQRVTVTLVYARLRYFDPDTGKRKDKWQLARNKTHALELIDDMKGKIKEHGPTALDDRHMTFAGLCDHYSEHYLKDAEYVDDCKVDGLRSLRSHKLFLRTLRQHFDRKRLDQITIGDCKSFRSKRIKTPTPADRARYAQETEAHKAAICDLPKREQKKLIVPRLRCTRAVASTNRELALLRRMFNVARKEGWMTKNPMSESGLISDAGERKRQRVLTFDEEARLLAACDGDRRKHLRPIVICALETGMRKAEILSLQWRDVDFANRQITIRAFNTKTLTSRQVAISRRLLNELEQLQQASEDATPDDRIFGITDNVKRSFGSARRAAGLPDVRFHDLRHTAATRLVRSHISLPEVGRILGHSQPKTTYRYVNIDGDTTRRHAQAFDAMRETEISETSDALTAEESIN